MIDHVSELNRVLVIVSALEIKGVGVKSLTVVEKCKSIAIEGRMPDHEHTIQFALEVGLLEAKDKDFIGLNQFGSAFLGLNPELQFDITESQRNFLLRRLFLDGRFRKEARDCFICFEESEAKGTFTWSVTDGKPFGKNQWMIQYLEQLGITRRTDTHLIVKKEFATTISEFISEPKGWTEDKLFEHLKQKKKLGDLAENLVMEWEVNRLANDGHEVESHCVKHIGKLDVGAGFDIKSFNGKADGMKFDRFIEVKGSKGPGIRFFWSDNEIEKAKALKDQYWIYYQGGVDTKSGTAKFEPICIQNPIVSLKKDKRLKLTGNGLIVEGKISAPERT